MSPACFNLPPQLFAKTFPFHFVFDRDMVIVQMGDVLQRVCPGLAVGSQMEQHLRLNRPNIPFVFDVIREQTSSLFLLEFLHNPIQLKGQMVYVEQLEVIFFLGSPWITEVATLKPLGLKLDDFAIHDPVVDFLFLLQSQNSALSETKQLTNKLTKQRAELREALKVKAELAATAQAQAQQLSLALQELQQTQAQLIQTEKMSSLGQMVAGVAHEINNPVSFIYGNLTHANNYTQDLLELVHLYQQHYPNPPPEIQDHISAIELDFLIEDLPKILSSMNVGAERIRQIVLSLRNFSRLDEAQMKQVDIHEGIDSTLLILQNRLKAHGKHPGIEVVKEYGDLPPVECYAGQLNQVFMNIISNAIDALDGSDSPCIRIRTEVSASDSIMVRIADNGPGMTESVKARLFDPFFTTKPVGKGTGLGLSISYQIIVEKHKGSLRCVSAPGQGTEFWIEIPLRQRGCPVSYNNHPTSPILI